MKFAKANKEVGTVQNLDGKFYVKDEDGNVIELKNGDVIKEGMVIIGDKGNSSSAKVEIMNHNSSESVVVSGDQEQSFDSSFIEGFANEAKDVSKSIENRFEEIQDRLESVSKPETHQPEVRESSFDKHSEVEIRPSQSIAMDDYYQATEDGTEYDVKEDVVDTIEEVDDSQNVSGNFLLNDAINDVREIIEEPAPVIQKNYDNKVVVDGDLDNNDKVRTKSDNDEIVVDGDVEDKAKIITGSGDDKVVIDGDVEDRASVSTGSGSDELVVDGDVEDKAKISTGSGDDKVVIGDDLEDQANLKTGSGEDEVIIEGDVEDKAKINLGSDDDKLTIEGEVETKNGFINGGSGDDKLILESQTQNDWDSGVKDRFINFEKVTFSDGNTISLVDTSSSNMSVTSITIDGVKYDVNEDNTEIVLPHGTITISPNGDFNYIIDNSNNEVQELNVGDSLNEVFSYTLSDGIHSSTANVTIAIDGRDDAPVIESIVVNESDVANNIIFDNITISDVDDADLEGASIALVNYQDGDTINIGDLPDGITATIVGASVELSGTASISDYESALKSLSFETTSSDSSSREFVFSVFDGDKHSEAQSITIEVSANQTVSDVLVEEDFEGGATGWSDNVTTNLGGELTEFLGRFGGTDGKEGVSKTFNLGMENAGKIVTVEFDMFEIDSWDGSNSFNLENEDGNAESFQVFINGSKVADDEYDAFSEDENTDGKDDSDGGVQVGNLSYDENGGWEDKDYERGNNEEIHHYSIEARVDEYGNIKLGFGSTLNEAIENESFGIDNIKISHSDSLEADAILVTDTDDNSVEVENHEVMFDNNYINVWGNPISEDDFTITLDLTPANTEDGYRGICGIQKGSDVDGRSPSMYQVGDRIHYDSVDADGNHYSGYIDNVFTDGENTNITWVKDGSEYRFYQDGELMHTADAPENVNVNNNYYFGEVSGSKFDGSMDNIRVYSKALTEEEVTIASKGMVADSGSLELHYDFEGSEPWADKSGNGLDAHLMGDPAPVIITTNESFDSAENLHLRNIEYHSDTQNSTDYDDYIESELTTGNANDTIIVEDDIGDENDYLEGHGGARTVNTGDGDDLLAVGGDIQHGATVNTGAGDDKIIVGDSDYLNLNLDDKGSIEAESSVNTGAGDDYLSADLLSDASVNMGDGNDTLSLKRVAGDSEIDTGAGNDEVTLNDVSSGFDDGSVNLGSGDDKLTIDDTLKGTEAIFDGGDGEDTLVLNNVTREEWDNGIKDNFVNFEHVVLNNLGEDNEPETNQITLDVNLSDDTTNVENTTSSGTTYRERPDMLEDIEDVTSTLAQSTDTIYEFDNMNRALYTEQNDDVDVIEVDGNSNTIMTYGGDDIINVDGNQNRAIDAGDGNNRIDIDGNSSSIYVQDGDDSIRIAGNQNRGIDLNDGDNQIDVAGNAENIYSGSGNDVVNIGGNANKNIGTEAGDDYVTIGGNSSKIDLGAGNDIIEIGGNVNRYVEGGDGVDSIILNNYSKADWDSNVGNIQNNIMNFENIKFNDGEIIGDSSAFEASNPRTTFQTTLSIVATQTNSDEAISNVQVEIPTNVDVSDANGNELEVVDGIVNLPVTNGIETSITLVSEERLTQDELDSIQDSVTIPATNSLDNDGVFDLNDGMDFDFSDDNLDNLHDITEIDMQNDSANSIEGITLDDILEMTDDNNTLTITGDDNDSLDISTDGWTQNGPTITDSDSGMTTYEYSNSSGDIITLNIDEQIHSTGM